MIRVNKSCSARIICLSGPDGAGKSSIARLFATFLSSRGLKVKVSWMRGTHTLASVLARFLGLFENLRAPDNPYYKIRVPKTLHALWIAIEVVSVLPVWFLKYLIPSQMGYIVVGDRGLVDFIVWLAMVLRRPKLINSIISRAILAMSVTNSIDIYVRASLEELVRRRTEEKDTVKLQLALYDAIAKAYGLPVIDTTGKSVGESCRELFRGSLGVLVLELEST